MIRYGAVIMSSLARLNSSRSPVLYMAIALVLLTLIVSACAAIAYLHSPHDAAQALAGGAVLLRLE